MTTGLTIENPKRQHAARNSSAGWYDYYAGYSPTFAKSLLESTKLEPGALIADPWNGSGTTTEIASLLGFKGYGYDLNPVMLVVAKARLLKRSTTPSIKPLALNIVELAKSSTLEEQDTKDLLSVWFKTGGVTAIRRLERAVQAITIDAEGYRLLSDRNLSTEVSDIAAFFYNALFRSVRSFLKPFIGSNPTWVRKPKLDRERIRVDLTLLTREFNRQVKGMLDALENVFYCHLDSDYFLDIANSTSLPLGDGSADLILTSPPYCTRIDYAITTLPELALLGFSGQKVRALRDGMIGTSTVRKAELSSKDVWGHTCSELLWKIKTHQAKASATYYYKTHLQYFDSVFKSLGECRRVLKTDGSCILVVQDSYYKDVHNDLPKIIAEMGRAQKLKLTRRVNFYQARTLAGVNRGAKEYRSCFGATEAVLCFKAED